MKKLLSILGGAILALAVLGTQALAVDFTVSATIPEATGISIVATRNQIVSGTEEFGPVVTAFDFDPMTPDVDLGIYTSAYFFAIDVGATGGAGSPDVSVEYSDESNPVGQATGFGVKATSTFSLVTGGPAPEDQSEAIIPTLGTKLLGQLIGGQSIDESLLAGGFLRMRVGVYDGANATLNTAGGEPFTNADQPGDYSGTFTVSATLD